MKTKVNKYKDYFKCGGVQKTSSCIDWCLRYNLSDPFDPDFQSECKHDDEIEKDQHSHSLRDATVVEAEEFFQSLINLDYDTAEKEIAKMSVIVNIDDTETTCNLITCGYLLLIM